MAIPLCAGLANCCVVNKAYTLCVDMYVLHMMSCWQYLAMTGVSWACTRPMVGCIEPFALLICQSAPVTQAPPTQVGNQQLLAKPAYPQSNGIQATLTFVSLPIGTPVAQRLR